MAWKKPKKKAPTPPPDIASDFENKPPPEPPADAPATDHRVYRWRGWHVAEWPMPPKPPHHPGGTGHLLFRREERAKAFLELVKAGNNQAAFRMALARMRRDWNPGKPAKSEREED